MRSQIFQIDYTLWVTTRQRLESVKKKENENYREILNFWWYKCFLIKIIYMFGNVIFNFFDLINNVFESENALENATTIH